MNIISFEQLDSTNTYSKKNIETLADKTVISADFQTNGYGRFNRTWVDLGSENIYMTFVLKPSDKLSEVHANLTQYLSVILCKQFEAMGLSPQIKWPNDVLLNGKKVCGILAESIIKGNILKGIVLGIGVNLNASSENLNEIDRPATSVNIELGQMINKQEFMQKLVENFFSRYDEFLANGFVLIKDDYEKRASLILSEISYLTPSPLEGEGWGGGYKNITRLYTKQTLEYAKELRRNMTDAEHLLWYFLRKKQMNGLKFRKQSPIGKYIADFVCFEVKLIIELDGGHHLKNPNLLNDKNRDEFLKNAGFTVLRIFNNEIFENIEGVLELIYGSIAPPNPNPPPQGGREKTSTLNNKYPPTSNYIKIAVFNKIQQGVFKGFDNDGTLLLLTSDGKIEKINMGEII